MIRIGVVNIDVSHPKAFSQVLKEQGRARYAALCNLGFRGEDEVEGFRRLAGLDRVCQTVEELAQCSDVGFIQGCNWDRHLAHALPFLQAGKPVFLDKPMVGDLKDCRALLELEQSGAVIMGSSSVRYCREIRQFLEQPEQERGKLLHIVATVGMDEFNYAIHAVEGICAIARSKPVSVQFSGRTEQDGQTCASYFIRFENGAAATCLCAEPRFMRFHFTVLTTRQDIAFTVDNNQLYAPMLEQICNRLEGKPNCLASVEELTWPIRTLLAGKLSAARGGEQISAWDPALEEVRFDGDAFAEKYAAAAAPMYL